MPEEAGAAIDRNIVRGKQSIEPRGIGGKTPAHVVLPGAVGERADAVFQRRTRDRPWPELGIEPFGDVLGSNGEAEADAGKAEEFAKRAQHDDAALPHIAAERFLARADIHEGFVHDQQAAAPAQCLGERQKLGARDDASVRIVGVHHHGEVGVGER